MKKIKPISSTWLAGSEKTDVFRLLNMIHAMAGQEAQRDNSVWSLKSTATDGDYVMTTWTNGIVDIVAETIKDLNENAVAHSYKMIEAAK